MKYAAFLRGVNVGGNNVIKMVDLKACFEGMGFLNVATLIQSGNVVFETDEKDSDKLEETIETGLSKTFKYKSKVLVRSSSQIKKVLQEAPSDWKSRKDIRCYIAFVKKPATPELVVKEVVLKEGIDSVKAGAGGVFMTSLLSGLTRSGINKIASTKIYQDLTIRNYNTTLKIAKLMESE